MTSLVTEIRTKLHIKVSNESEVKNLWMCLNYDQKPTVAHVIDHVKKNLLDKSIQKDVSECKLYLDNYWLPPYENSRLIRENDCIKVEVTCDEVSKSSETVSTAQKLAELNQNVLNHIKATEQRVNEKQKQMEKTESNRTGLSPEEIATVEAATKAAAITNTDYYNHYYDSQAYYGRSNEMTAYNYWLNNEYFNNQMIKDDTNKKSLKQVQNETIVNKQPVSQPKTTTKSSKETTNCYKKFAIGSYAHLLSEPVQPPQEVKNKKKGNNKNQKKQQFQDVTESDNVSEEQLIDNYYEAIQKKKEQTTKNQKTNEASEEFEKISSNVNSTGRQKWKNSTQPTKSNGPKHIIFKTSSSDDSSDSESESDKSPAKEQTKKSTKVTSVTKASTSPSKKINLEQTKTSKYYEPSKQEQLDAVSYNRSYFIQNAKNLVDFKKIFNEEKLNAPQSEEFADKSEYLSDKKKKSTEKQMMNTSTSSTDSTESEKSKRRDQRVKSPSPAKINYDSYQSLLGAPRVNDKVAFQILEISSNFTPEVSEYKTGTVIEFDENTNEITLEMNNKYNQVLKRSNKFSVILDETDNNDEMPEEISSRRNSEDMENLLKVDWRNLMNLKLIPDEKQMTKQQQFSETKNLIVHV